MSQATISNSVSFHSTQTIQSSSRVLKSSKTLVFIDANVDDSEYLAQGVKPGIEVHILDAHRDGIEQITAHLFTRPHLEAIHIVSHGSPGCLYLGNSQLNLDTLKRYANLLQTWFAPLTPQVWGKPSLLLYGCNVAAGDAGEEFVTQLAQLTEAEVYASNAVVGSSERGGSWKLRMVGNDEDRHPIDVFTLATIASYTGLFVTINPTGGTDSTNGIQIQIEPDGNFYILKDNTRQTFSFGNSDTVLSVGTTTYGEGYYNQSWVSLGQSAVTGSGTSSDPYQVVTSLLADVDSNGTYDPAIDFKLDWTISYVNFEDYYAQDFTVVAPVTNTQPVKLAQAFDSYLGGSDRGPAYGLDANGTAITGTADNPKFIGVSRNLGLSNEIVMGYIEDNAEFSRWYSGGFSNPYSQLNSGGNLTTTYDTNASTDNGIAVQYDLGTLTGTTTISNFLAFSTEAVNTVIDQPPILSITDTSDYGGTPVVVAPNLTVTDSDGGDLEGATVIITDQLNGTAESLGIAGQTGTSGTVEGLAWNYDANTGVMTLTGTADIATYQAALRQVTYSNSSATPDTTPRSVEFALGTNLANSDNGHFYEFVTDPGISWTDARDAAEARSYFGLKGYLTTVTSSAENDFISGKLAGEGWMGSSDATTEGDWRWVTGPEAGTQFWSGVSTGSPVGGEYNNWATSEPNDFPDAGGEDYGHFLNDGKWNDYPLSLSNIEGYVVEYGGMPDDPTLQITGTATVNFVPQVQFSGLSFSSVENVGTSSAVTLTRSGDTSSPSTVTVSVAAGGTATNGTDYNSSSFPLTINFAAGETSKTVDIPIVDDGTIEGNETINLSVAAGTNAVLGAQTTTTLTITDDDHAPTFTSGATASVPENTTTPVTTVTATDADGDTPTYSITGGADAALFSLDANSGVLTFNSTPDFDAPADADDNNIYELEVTANDGNGNTAVQTLQVNVTNVNEAPSFTTAAPTSGTQDQVYTYEIDTADPDSGDSRTITNVASLPSWLTLTDNGGGKATLSGTPTNAEIGDHTVELQVTDAAGVIATQTFTITVDNTNDAPTLSGTPVTSVDEDSAYSFTPTFEDVDGDDLSFSIVNKPSWATFDPNTGQLSGTPTNDHVGVTENIVISVSDGTASVSLPAFNLTVDNTNDAPTISGTPTTSVDEDSAYSFTPTANDVDIDGATFSFSIVNKPSWATFDPNTGQLSGTPTNNHVGVTENIVISVSDGTATTPLPAFNLTVNNTNDAPSFSSTAPSSAIEDSLYSYNIQTEDPDTGDSRTITNGATLPSWLSLTDNGNGKATLTGTPTNDNVGIHTVELQVTDGAGATDTQTFDVTVANTNDAPTISGTPATSVAEDSSYSFTPTVDDVDGNLLSFSITNKPSWATFDSTTGQLSGTPTNDDVGITEDIVISVSDGTVVTPLPAFNLSVNNVNDAPVFTSTAPTSGTQDQAYTYNIVVEDPDTGDSPTITNVAPLPSWLTLIKNADGTTTLTGTPTNAEIGDHTVELQVEDASGEIDTQTFTISVDNTNDAPTISGTPATSIDEDSAYSFVPTVNDVDGDTLSFSITNKPSWATFDSATGQLSGTPTNEDVGTSEVIVISVNDGTATVELPAFSLTVNNINNAPVFSSTAPTSANEDSLYTYTITTEDLDIGDSISITSATLPSWLNLTDNGDRTATLTGTPTNDNVGTHTVELQVTDAAGETDTQTFDVAVANTNDAATISGTPNTSVDEDSAYSFAPSVNDVDGDTLSFSITNKPSWATFDSTTGQLSGTPTNDDVGITEDIVISVSDGTETIELPAFSLTVNGINDTPEVVDAIPPQTEAQQGEEFNLNTGDYFNDPDGEGLTYSAEGLPSGLSIDPETGVISGTPDNDAVGTYPVKVIATDPSGTSAETSFDLTIGNVNDTPEVSQEIPPQTEAQQGEEFNLNTGDYFNDPDGEGLTYSAEGLPDGLSIDPETGVISGTPDNDAVGTYPVKVIATDPSGTSAETSFDLTIGNVNDAPQVVDAIPPQTEAQQGEEFNLNTGDYFNDPDGEGLTYSAEGLPDGLSIDPETGVISGTPDNDAVGTYPVKVIATDPSGTSAETSFDLTIGNVNDTPTVSEAIPNTNIDENGSLNFQIPSNIFEDVDPNDTLGYTATLADGSPLPRWLTFNPETGTFSGTPDNSAAGSFEILVTATDSAGATASQTFTLTVNDIPEPEPQPEPVEAPATPVLNETVYDPTDFVAAVTMPVRPSNPAANASSNNDEVTPDADVIVGDATDNQVNALGGDDLINTGDGDDWISSNQGNDTVDGGSGDDTIFAGKQNDVAFGSDGNDELNGNIGDDFVDGGEGNDTVFGGQNNDTLTGGNGNDWLNGNLGEDFVDGGEGEDLVYGGQDGDTLMGGSGNDTLSGNIGNDFIEGNDGNDLIYGGKDNDTLSGNQGNDTLYGDLGDDVVDGGEGTDIVFGGEGDDTLDGGEGNDELTGGNGNDLLLGAEGNDTLTGEAGSDRFVLASGMGEDLITDFTDGEDIIVLDGGLTFDQLTLTQNNGSTLIQLNSELLATLDGVNIGLITANDFTTFAA
ncbi:hemolysin-type calcium-binding repeat family protein [Lyngbya aestuarii BL J]|uniref:Hemolysin-type calcium-binding repeat family protein n=1 Tax=Lyngbya aestuarii BL J TaxID=1348334 RepID=U7QIX7_9CYAN|nr:putative Ig domain-containing protein [Lyngbya aestuarii]ERT07040.1 hemolysin-type calcium-binding repeat family protein [Lyngbya aestuarii BL J]